jgi:DNA polymerase-3 subunit epsilon/ATP-dependent DNA helicase DinG
MRGEFVALDLETTGLDIQLDSIIEIGAVRMKDGIIIGEYTTLVDPGFVIPVETTRITGIYQEDLRGAPSLAEVLPQIDAFIGDALVIAHNAAFDVNFMRRFHLLEKNQTLDTVELASILLPRFPRYNLGVMSKLLGIDLENAHRALDDARATALLYWKLWEQALTLPISIVQEICYAAEPFDWEGGSFFDAVLIAKQAENGVAAPVQIDSFDPLPADIQALRPAETQQPLNPEDVDQLLNQNGKLATVIEHYEQRPQQLMMAHAIVEAFNAGKHLMVEAGTGTGKSLAYLAPAMKWAALNNARVMISTNTINLQEQLLHKDVPLLQSILGEPIQATLMKGRDHYLCPRRLAAVRRRRPTNLDELRTLAKILIWLLESKTGDKGEINLRFGEHSAWNRMSAGDEGCTMHRCSTMMHGTCPFYKARKKAEAAQIVIVNHALLIADATSENRVLPDYQHVIVDEAHQLEDALTYGLSIRMDAAALLRRLNDLGGINSGILGDLLKNTRDRVPEKTLLRLEAFIQSIGEAIDVMNSQVRVFFGKVYELLQDIGAEHHTTRIDPKLRDHASFSNLRDAWNNLDEFFAALVDAMQHLTGALGRLEKYAIPEFDDHSNSAAAAARYLTDVRNTLNAFALQPDANTIYWINASQNPEAVSIQAAPLHVGPMMEQHIWQAKETAILTSATLQTHSNFNFIKERLYADTVETLSVGSPFDYKNSTLIFVPEDIPEPTRNGYQKAVERGIIELASALNGRVLVLFTSYTQLRETASNIAPRLALGNIVVYDQATGGNRETLLDSFKSTDKAVLLGTKSFWEGVDIPGEDLSGVIIVRLPFAVPSDPIFAARSDTYNNHFQDYAIPDAILRFRQGFGRLIRTRSDRGIVAIFDSRVINKSYGMSFLEALPDCTLKYGALSELAKAARNWLNLA